MKKIYRTLLVVLLSAGVFSVKAQDTKKKMDDKTLKNSYLYATYKPHVYPTWPTRFLYREFSLPSHLKHPAQNPAVSENRMQF